MFKKVIGHQDPQPSVRPNSPLTETRRPDPVVTQNATANAAAPAPAARPLGGGGNVLSADVEIKGTVRFTNNLLIDGKIEGEIFSNGNLTVGENARIKAEVKTATVTVYGKVHGNLTATERVELKANAEVVGDIKAKILSIEAGAIFIGKSTVGTTAQATPAAPAAAAPATPAPAATKAAGDQPKQAPLPGTQP